MANPAHIADDAPCARQVLAMPASRRGAERAIANIGMRAPWAGRRRRFDLNSPDRMMPPVPILTGHLDTLVEQRLLPAGAAGFFYKPIQPDEIRHTLPRFLTS